jgi:hypothetical protein
MAALSFDTLGFSKVRLPACPKEHELLENFYNQAKDKSETERIALAKELCSQWSSDPTFQPYLPAVPNRADYWYLIQLFALDRHVDKKGKPQHFSLAEKEVWIENFTNPQERSPFLSHVCAVAKKDHLTRILPREDIDDILNTFNTIRPSILDSLGLNSEKFSIRLIRFDEYIRIASQFDLVDHEFYTHFDGYRLRPTGKKDGLIGGTSNLGRTSYIDSWWLNQIHHQTIFRCVIAPKESL